MFGMKWSQNFFSQPRLSSPVCVAWCSVLLPYVEYSTSLSLDPKQHYLRQALDVGHLVKSEVMWEDELPHNVNHRKWLTQSLCYLLGVWYLSFNWNHFEMWLLNVRINFYSRRTFCPHLGSLFLCVCVCVVSSFTTFRQNFTSGLLQVIYRDLG